MATLLQTLVCTVRQDPQFLNATEDQTNTPAGTHDSNDATADGVSILDGFGFGRFNYELSAYTGPDTIEFLRFRFRFKGTVDDGQDDLAFSWFSTSTAGFLSSIPPFFAQLTFQDFFLDVPLVKEELPDETVIERPWTAADLNASVLTANMSHIGPDPVASIIACSEMFVEVWGVASVRGLGGYTSYDLALTDPDIGAKVSPEVEAAIRRGDRRYMEGR